METTGKVKTVSLVTISFFFMGLCLVMFSVLGSYVFKWPDVINAFIRDFGLLLSAVMAGTILHEKLLRDEMLCDIVQNLEDKLDKHEKALHKELLNDIHMDLDQLIQEWVPQKDDNAQLIANKTWSKFSESPPTLKGINLVNDTRRNFSGYYTWIIEQKDQDLFFAGRSVLHRIDSDIRFRKAGTMEEIVLRKLKEGSRIHILFLDPRMDIIDRLAIEEGQEPENLLGDVAESLGICQRIFNLIKNDYKNIQQNAKLSVKVYDRIPYFAYHRQDDIILIGFYFLTGLGCTSALYEVLDDKTKEHFGDHFEQIFLQASPIIEFNGGRGRPVFKDTLFTDMYSFLETKLGKDLLEERFNKNDKTP